MRARLPVRWNDLVAVVAVAVLGFAVWTHRRAVDRAVQQYTHVALRAQSVDGLIGQALPELPLPDGEGRLHQLSKAGQDRVVWFVDPDECRGCLADVREWNAFVAGPSQPGLTVLLGVSPEDGARLARGAGIRGLVLTDSAAQLKSILGLALPSSFVAVDPAGTVRMADARYSEQSCDWSFVEQVVALRDAGPIDGAVARR